jgi:hypothetical protein
MQKLLVFAFWDLALGDSNFMKLVEKVSGTFVFEG